MKTRGHILGSFLLAVMFSMTHVVLGQEEGFNIPNVDLESSGSGGSNTAGEHRDSFIIDPEKKTEKTGDKKSKKEDPDKNTQEQQRPSKKKPEKIEAQKNQPSETSNPDNSPKSNEENADESVLSFNFLYYMIQKFKFSDVIDQ